ncbi:PREDICTED: F-box/FBD/LRR-repeat protein At5g56420-like [Camelina sativa]|uniref:F-box/FBD/LRR-repeat protein At5g56420-like n=1 Tax=Camelina sativa TaxID=90675 RepID=A0ABM1QJ69_CAMSA|nr:PREDICTED: F-box/FBD/LRR-repeat protein At5g56420-like [Camelina sativa]
MDKISHLSDDLLIKILSLVPTKDAIAMSTLSKRWMSLWTLVPRLVFDDYSDSESEDEENQSRNLAQFVSGTLLLHKAAVLESFHLNIASSECSGSEVGLWVRIAVDRLIRDLKISFYNDHSPVRLPSRLFRCETIETLELCRVIALEVPSCFSFRSLKNLRLLSVRYSDEGSFSRFISNCPVLEDLVVETCDEDNVVTFTVNVPSLQSLSVSRTLRDLPNPDEVFVIHSHGLKQLKVVDYYGELHLIGNLPKLVEANLQYECLYAKVLEPFTSVKRLYLCLFGEAQYLTGTVLSQLVCLELCTCEDNWTKVLVSVLQHAPKLQVLKLELNQDHCLATVRDVCWIQPERVPECLLYQLKTLEWRNYGGTQVEKEVAMYFLKNASRLVTATIYPDSVKLARKHKMFEKLDIATRSSRACELRMG